MLQFLLGAALVLVIGLVSFGMMGASFSMSNKFPVDGKVRLLVFDYYAWYLPSIDRPPYRLLTGHGQ